MAFALTRKKQLKLLTSFLITNKEFRAEFLKDPKKAARKLAIDLTEEEIVEVEKFKKQILKAATAGDAALGGAGFHTLNIPVYSVTG